MDLAKLMVVCLVVLIGSKCFAGIIKETFNIDEPVELVEATVKILSSCYEKKINTVGLAGIPEEIFFKTLWRSKRPFPVALIDNITSVLTNVTDRKSRHKLQIFLVTASRPKQLERVLKKIKDFPWWNHMATYLILECQSNTGCSNAFEYLSMAWKRNLLNAVYMCVDRTKGRLIYSYNPFTWKAPEPWQLVKTYKTVKTNHPWSLFVRDYQDDREICEQLDFDKAKDLNGYEIRFTAKDYLPFWITNHNENGTNSFGGSFGNQARIIFHAFNASPHWIHSSLTEEPGLIGITTDTISGISDIMLLPRYTLSVMNFTFSSPYMESGLGILTQNRGNVSELEKILNVLDRRSRFGLCLVIVNTVMFFMFCLRQSFASGLLNILRIISNAGLTKIPSNPAARIYLAGVFFLAVTILAIYQGKFASLLSKPKFLPNVDTTQDLADLGYTIHGHRLYAPLFSDRKFNRRFVEHEDYRCTDYVLRDSMAACVWDRNTLLSDAIDFKLHLSNKMFMKMHLVYLIREDWPLEKRFNRILAALIEADIPRMIMMGEVEKLLSINDYYKKQQEIEQFKIIKLNEMIFAFVLLGIGLISATLCFIFETRIECQSRLISLCARIRNRL